MSGTSTGARVPAAPSQPPHRVPTGTVPAGRPLPAPKAAGERSGEPVQPLLEGLQLLAPGSGAVFFREQQPKEKK